MYLAVQFAIIFQLFSFNLDLNEKNMVVYNFLSSIVNVQEPILRQIGLQMET